MSKRKSKAKRTFRDTLFRSYMATPENLAAVHTTITNIPTSPKDISITTLQNVFWERYRNDVSYDVGERYMVLGEQQTTKNGNMPLRMLIYAVFLYINNLPRRVYFKENTQSLKFPEFYDFYFGDKNDPLEETLKLSDAFPKDITLQPMLEVTVKRFNIRYDPDPAKRSSLLECVPIHDYSYFVNSVETMRENGRKLDYAIAKSMDHCIELNIMKDFLLKHYSEVFDMYKLKFTKQDVIDAARSDGFEDGEEKGILSSLQNLMKNMSWSAEQAMNALSIPVSEQSVYAAMLKT